MLLPQFRFFDREAVEFVEQVHTPGFKIPLAHGGAPETAFFIHFNNIIRSADERLAKVRTYATCNRDLAWRVMPECLPELFINSFLAYDSGGLGEFQTLIKEMPKPKARTRIRLSKAELSQLDFSRRLVLRRGKPWFVYLKPVMPRTLAVFLLKVGILFNIERLRIVAKFYMDAQL